MRVIPLTLHIIVIIGSLIAIPACLTLGGIWLWDIPCILALNVYAAVMLPRDYLS